VPPAMTTHIRAYSPNDHARVLEICIAAFTPIHQGFQSALGEQVFALQYHDWQEQYARTLERISPDDSGTKVYVAEREGVIAGFVFTILDTERKTGEIGLNAVDPAWQRKGIGRAMYEFAFADLKARGAQIAYVGTGGDTAHAPAQKGLCRARLRQGDSQSASFQSVVGSLGNYTHESHHAARRAAIAQGRRRDIEGMQRAEPQLPVFGQSPVMHRAD
jgi:ribosomal protein S18 acetylase RimI-like enzyme